MDDLPVLQTKINNYTCSDVYSFKSAQFSHYFYSLSGLTFFVLKIRSCSSLVRFDLVKELLLSLNVEFDFVILVETWIKVTEEKLYTIDGYKSYLSSRGEDGYGRVAFYLNESIKAEVTAKVTSPFNLIELTVTLPGLVDLILLAMYRPHKR